MLASQQSKNMNPNYQVKLEYFYDRKGEEWRAKITWTEHRCGKQYGGAVVQEMKGHKDCSATHFMRLCREQVAREMRIYWT